MYNIYKYYMNYVVSVYFIVLYNIYSLCIIYVYVFTYIHIYMHIIYIYILYYILYIIGLKLAV